MDINSVLHFVSSQIEKIIGVVAALFIATTALLIFRSIKEEKSVSEAGGHGTDPAAIEDALRRVLAQNPMSARADQVETSHAPRSTPISARDEGNREGDKEKDERINALQSALQKAQVLLKERLEEAAIASEGTPDPAAEAAHLELKKEVAELRARLTEYEIIEDDIADLAMFKEENARLKQEVESFKASSAASSVAGSAAAETVVPASPVAKLPLTEAAPGSSELGVEALGDLVDTDKLIDELNAPDAEDLMSEFKDKGKS